MPLGGTLDSWEEASDDEREITCQPRRLPHNRIRVGRREGGGLGLNWESLMSTYRFFALVRCSERKVKSLAHLGASISFNEEYQFQPWCVTIGGVAHPKVSLKSITAHKKKRVGTAGVARHSGEKSVRACRGCIDEGSFNVMEPINNFIWRGQFYNCIYGLPFFLLLSQINDWKLF